MGTIEGELNNARQGGMSSGVELKVGTIVGKAINSITGVNLQAIKHRQRFTGAICNVAAIRHTTAVHGRDIVVRDGASRHIIDQRDTV